MSLSERLEIGMRFRRVMQQILQNQRIFLNTRDWLVQQVLQRERLLVRGVEDDVGNDFLELRIVGAALLHCVDGATVIVQEGSIKLNVVSEALEKVADLNVAVWVVPLLLPQLSQELIVHIVELFNLEKHRLELVLGNHRLRRRQRRSNRFHVLRHLVQALHIKRLAGDDAGDDLVDDGAARAT